MTKYTGTLVAPYWRFRRTVAGVAADVLGCHWTCDRCWSRYGWWSVRPRHELTPEGMEEKVEVYGVRELLITGGEPGLYWPHMVGVAELCAAGGIALTIETAGLIVGPSELDALDEASAGEATVRIGVKASDAEALAALTGLPAAVAERAHARQMEAVRHGTFRTRLATVATFLDSFTTRTFVTDVYASGIQVEVLRMQRVEKEHRFYTPKRHRRRAAR